MEHTATQHIAHSRLSLFTYRVYNESRSTFDEQLKMHIARRSMIVKLISEQTTTTTTTKNEGKKSK